MEQETEKRMIKRYEITQSIHIGGRDVVFGINEKKEMLSGGTLIWHRLIIRRLSQ